MTSARSVPLGLTTGGQRPARTTIDVGVITTLSDADSSSDKQAGTVAWVWADWIKGSGDTDCHPVKVTIEDDQGTPAVAQSDELDLPSKGVVAIVDGSDAFLAGFDSAAVAQSMPVISSPSYIPDWFTKAGLFFSVSTG